MDNLAVQRTYRRRSWLTRSHAAAAGGWSCARPNEERALIDRAVAASGTDLTEFVVTHASEAARRVLADRQSFELDAAALAAWEEVNSRPARELPGLAALFRRPSPFAG